MPLQEMQFSDAMFVENDFRRFDSCMIIFTVFIGWNHWTGTRFEIWSTTIQFALTACLFLQTNLQYASTSRWDNVQVLTR